MKRQEMVTLLVDFLNVMQEDESIESEEQIADRILSALEAAGMGAPEVAESVPTFVQNNLGQVIQTEDSTTFVRKWE